VPLFLEALRGKVAQLVQYITFPLHNIGFLEGPHPIAAELKMAQLVQYCTFPLQGGRFRSIE